MKYCLIKDEDTYMEVYGKSTMEQAGDIKQDALEDAKAGMSSGRA